jgi:GTP-binding protein
MSDILTAKYLISSPNVSKGPLPDRPEFAFIGRSNVGKSSLINLLTNQSGLAKVSSSPGKTQMINHFLINGGKDDLHPDSWYLVDLPGYGYAKISQTQRAAWKKMIMGYFETRANLFNVFLLIDSRLEPQKIDIAFMETLGEIGIPFTLVFTKADKNKQSETAKNVKNFLNKMKENWQFLPAHFVTSTVKKYGRTEIIRYINEAIIAEREAENNSEEI